MRAMTVPNKSQNQFKDCAPFCSGSETLTRNYPCLLFHRRNCWTRLDSPPFKDRCQESGSLTKLIARSITHRTAVLVLANDDVAVGRTRCARSRQSRRFHRRAVCAVEAVHTLWQCWELRRQRIAAPRLQRDSRGVSASQTAAIEFDFVEPVIAVR
jgi:hypothetical protein